MWRFISVVFLCLMPFTLPASPLSDAEMAIRAGKASQGLSILDGYRPSTRDETLRHLWALGIAYNRLGRHQEAVAPLTRLVALSPKVVTFRLELAAALMRAGQLERARYQLELAKGAGLPDPVQRRVQAAIDGMAKPKTWQGSFRFALIPESNPVRRTAVDTVTLNGLVFGLRPTAREQASSGVELGFGLAALPRLSESLRARIGVDVTARAYDVTAANDATLRLNAALLHFGAQSRQQSLEVFSAKRWIANEAYSTSRGVTLGMAQALGASSNLATSLLLDRTSYLQGGFHVDRRAAAVQLSHAVSPQLVLKVSGRLEQRSSAVLSTAGHAAGVTLGADYAFAGGVRLGIDLSYDRNAFSGIHPLFGVAREDKRMSANLQVTNQNWSYKGFAPVLRLGAERQRSTLPLNSFRNLSASFGVTRLF
jgi:outer membrane protein